MTAFRVAPEWHDDDQLPTSQVIVAEYASDAAREFVLLNMANLDYPTRVTIKTLQYDDNDHPVIRKFDVVQIPDYEARETTGSEEDQ